MSNNTQQLPDELQQQIKEAANEYARIPLPNARELGLAYYDGATEWALKYWQTNLENSKLRFSNAQYETYTEELRKILERLWQENEKLRQRIDSTLREERKKLQAELTKIDVDWATRYHGLEVKHQELKEKAEKMAEALAQISQRYPATYFAGITAKAALSNYNSEKEGKQ